MDLAWNEPRLALRMNMHREWIWELRSHDLHVVNRSESGFSTRQACLLDAGQRGFTLGADRSPRTPEE